ncbi:hypothetical protein R5R35_002451 [Gryllus longicercus]|uniref:Uncharacterized protein n=1 Tax=Gryllus longicercus TaxID=2509291 RepID=A0AAN9VRQ4_9ORTH
MASPDEVMETSDLDRQAQSEEISLDLSMERLNINDEEVSPARETPDWIIPPWKLKASTSHSDVDNMHYFYGERVMTVTFNSRDYQVDLKYLTKHSHKRQCKHRHHHKSHNHHHRHHHKNHNHHRRHRPNCPHYKPKSPTPSE